MLPRRGDDVSDFRTFFVEALPAAQEKEPNSDFSAPQPVDLTVTVVGNIGNEDVDYFVISAEKGQRLSVEIEAVRLGAMFDPFIAVLNKDRFELGVSDDTPQFKQDGFISIKIPADGEYYVMVRETSYGGSDICRYRLHIGDFPRPRVAFPAGGKAGDKLDVTFMGDPLGEVTKVVSYCEDWATTIYKCMGIVADKELMAPGGRPIEIVDGGKIRTELLV